jgi:hypothetical protein
MSIELERREKAQKFERKLEEEQKKAEEAKKNFPKLSKQIILGKRYSENMVVKAIDGDEYEVEVHALGEQDFIEALKEAGLNWEDLTKAEKTIENLKFQRMIAAKSISSEKEAWSEEEIGRTLRFGEAAKIAAKCFEISGLTEKAQESVEPFRIPVA